MKNMNTNDIISGLKGAKDRMGKLMDMRDAFARDRNIEFFKMVQDEIDELDRIISDATYELIGRGVDVK